LIYETEKFWGKERQKRRDGRGLEIIQDD